MSEKGSSREREQSARWCRLSTGRLTEEGRAPCLGSFHTASLNWCLESSKCQLIWHMLCLPVSNRRVDSAAGRLLVTSQWIQKHARTDTCRVDIRCGGSSSHFCLMLHSVAACGICVYAVELSEMERVHTFVSLTSLRHPLGRARLSLQRSWPFSRWSELHPAYSESQRDHLCSVHSNNQLCFYLQITVCTALGLALCSSTLLDGYYRLWTFNLELQGQS